MHVIETRLVHFILNLKLPWLPHPIQSLQLYYNLQCLRSSKKLNERCFFLLDFNYFDCSINPWSFPLSSALQAKSNGSTQTNNAKHVLYCVKITKFSKKVNKLENSCKHQKESFTVCAFFFTFSQIPFLQNAFFCPNKQYSMSWLKAINPLWSRNYPHLLQQKVVAYSMMAYFFRK